MKEKGKEQFQLVIGSARAIQCKTIQEAKQIAKVNKREGKIVHLYIWKGTGKKEKLVKYF